MNDRAAINNWQTLQNSKRISHFKSTTAATTTTPSTTATTTKPASSTSRNATSVAIRQQQKCHSSKIKTSTTVDNSNSISDVIKDDIGSSLNRTAPVSTTMIAPERMMTTLGIYNSGINDYGAVGRVVASDNRDH